MTTQGAPVGFNALELAILNWMQTRYSHPTLSAQLESARFLQRKWTGHGCYVDFVVAKAIAPLDLGDFGGHWPIDGPQITSSAIDHGGAAILWGQDGYPDCIEMYAYGGFFHDHVVDFVLSPSPKLDFVHWRPSGRVGQG